MAINAPVSRNGLRVLMMHDCLIEVTRFDSGESAIFWLAGYLDNETYINIDGTFDHTMLSYDDFEQDLMDHLGYDPHEESLRWDYDSPSQLQVGPQNPPAFPVRGYNTWVAALLGMQHDSSSQVNSAVQSTSTASSPIMTVYFGIA